MAAITVKDLHTDRTLDGKTMSSVHGRVGGAPWVYGWIRPYVEQRFGSAINFYQTINFYIADQMNNQIQVIDVDNSAANATIHVAGNQTASNAIR
jgi:hypothetical protein